jgi:hypothetical protein
MGKYIRDYQVDNFSDEDLEQIKPKKNKIKKFKEPKNSKDSKKKPLRKIKDEI